MVGPRLQQLRASRLAAQRELAAARPRMRLDEASVRQLINELGPIHDVLADADPEAKIRLYQELGIALTHHATKRLVQVQALPVYLRSCRRGDLNS